MMLLRSVLLAVLILAADLSRAAPDAIVEGVQLPAWITRDGKRQPLAIGTEIKRGDELATGDESRLLLRLGDGSTVKLGENGTLKLSDLVQKRRQGFFAATLNVLEGAFRFTTSAVAKHRVSRNVTVKLPTLTAGIRGTDIWGKNLGDKEVLVLIEGKITVTRVGDQPVQMNDAMTYLQAPNAGTAIVEAVPLEQLKVWAAETEIASGTGALRKDGRWKLFLGSYRTQSEALSVYDRLRREGYPVRLRPRRDESGAQYRLRLAGFASEQEATSMGARLKASYPRLDPRASLQ